MPHPTARPCRFTLALSMLPLWGMVGFACASTPPGKAPGASASAQGSASTSSAMGAAEGSAVGQMDEGERILEVAGGDCARACVGLAKVEAGRSALCAGGSVGCKDAERRVTEARRRVAAFCEPCAGVP